MTSNIDKLQQLTAEIHTEQAGLRKAVIANSNQIKLLADTVEKTNDRLQSLERNRDISSSRYRSGAGLRLASIPELVEAILPLLPIRDLLLAQRVSRCFRAVIEESKAIQRILFLLPEPVTPGLRETGVRINPPLIHEKSFIGIPL